MEEKTIDDKLNKNGKSQGMHPNSRVNLDKGRKKNKRTAKDFSITRIIREMLDQPAEERWLETEDKEKKFTWRQAIAKRILIEAVRGNAKVTSELLDRLEGKVTQPIGGDIENPIFVKLLSRLRGYGNSDTE